MVDSFGDELKRLCDSGDDLLGYLSTVLKDEVANKQKSLKTLLEDEIASIHSHFIKDYRENVLGVIEERLRQVELLEEMVTESIDKITVNRDRIDDIIRRSTESKKGVEESEDRIRIVSGFRDLFLIDESVTENVLASGNLDTTLLDYMDLIEKKRSNCRKLLELVPNARLAIESLNHSVEVLELMYEKIFIAVKNGSGSLNSKSLNRALLFVQERPHLLDQAVGSVARHRGDSLGLKFISLLRDGLESTAFDTVRFVSDMLSWLLEQLLEEHSFLDSVLTGIRSKDSQLPLAIDNAFSGVVEMISMRFDTSIEQTYSVIDLFKLCRVLDFYSLKIQAQISRFPDSLILHDMQSFRQKSWSKFHHQWDTRVHLARTQENFFLQQNHIQALQPVPFVTETAYLLDSLLDIYTDSSESTDDEIFSLLSSGIDPLIQLCIHLRNSMSAIDGCVFFLNCLSSIQSPLRKYRVAENTVTNLNTLIDSEMEVLITQVTEFILKRVGLFDKLETIRRIGNGDVLNEPEFHPIGISSSLKGFYSTLFTQGIVASSSQVDLLITRELRSRARQEVSRNIADAYETIYKIVSSDRFGGIASHTPDQVRALLDV